MDLVRLGRLSVQTVKDNEWDIVMEMAGEKKVNPEPAIYVDAIN